MMWGRYTNHGRLFTFVFLLYCLSPTIIWDHLDREASATQKTVLIFIPYEYIMCGLCLEKFDAILDSLETATSKQIIWGIITYPNVGKNNLSDTTLGVIAKQIRGLAKGRSIKFPLIFDQDNIFQDFTEVVSVIILEQNSTPKIHRTAHELNRDKLSNTDMIE